MMFYIDPRLVEGGRRGGRAHRKLTPDQVLTVRHLAAGGTKQADIARRFGVTQSTISRTVNGHYSGHIGPQGSNTTNHEGKTDG